MDDHAIGSVSVLAALTDATRQRLLRALITSELSVSELVSVLRLPQSTVSRHLKILKAAGLIKARPLGAAVMYHAGAQPADPNRLRPLLIQWMEGESLPDDVLARLERVVRARQDSAAGFFDRLGSRWDELRASAFGDAFAFEAMISLLPASWRVADIGTGTGILLPTLAEHFSEVIAVEPAETMLECARRRVAEAGQSNVTFHHGELANLPIADSSCDLAIACLVIHHVAEPASALAQMHRILRPGGRLLIVEQYAHENQEFYETMQDRWWGFDPAEFSRLVETVGFDEIAIRSLRRCEPRRRGPQAPNLFVLNARRPDVDNQKQ